jgi:hypothetical protein
LRTTADLRAPDRILVELADARRQFEKGAAAPVAVRDRLVELAGALADSGPLELGVSPRRWLRAQAKLSALVGVSRDDAPPGQLTAARARKALRQLRRLMRLSAWSARWRKWTHGSRWAPFVLFAVAGLLVISVIWLTISFARGGFPRGFWRLALSWLLLAVLVLPTLYFAVVSLIMRASQAAHAR